MALKGGLYKALLQKTGSQQTMSRWAQLIDDKFGPMSPDEARLVMAHEFGIKLADYGISPELQDRVRSLRVSGASLDAALGREAPGQSPKPTNSVSAVPQTLQDPAAAKPATPAVVYASRNLHPLLTQKTRKLFTSGNRAEAVAAAMRSVNNRVKRMSKLPQLDGVKLMNKAFSEQSPALQLNDLSTETGRSEQSGLRSLLVGGMSALRNPPVHEDEWEHDGDVDVTLECLGFASLMHRFLDRCDQYMAESDSS